MADPTRPRTADFDQANRAFDLFTLAERRRALEIFAGLKYQQIDDRFFEAVYRVIEHNKAEGE